MLIFHKLRYKNFMAVGEAPVELQLDQHQRTLVVGINGSGKSSIAEALTFVLFNKSYRGMNKPQLINSINGRDCVVEVWFSQGKDSYYVKRGMRPNIFEIHKNGKMLNQDSATRDQQAWFEEFILGMDFNSFAQIVTLGSALYKPFMMLSAFERRIIVENILGIEIFGKMLRALKTRISVWKENFAMTQGDLKTSETEKNLVSGFIANLQESMENKMAERRAKLKEIKKETDAYNRDIVQINEKVAALAPMLETLDRDELTNAFVGRSSTRKATENECNKLKKEIKFFETSAICPTCDQPIDEAHKKRHLAELATELETKQAKIAKLLTEEDGIRSDIAKLEELSGTMKNLTDSVWSLEQLRKSRASQALEIYEEIKNEKNNNNGALDSYQARLAAAEAEVVKQRKKHEALILEKSLQEYASIILKDTGIKAQIIKNYIPVINHLVNNFLRTLNFFVKFEIYENFAEVIKSRGRDEFTYHSFSMGERTRIDLALLFTWREIARMRNSLSTNLIIFDEIGDSSLDQEGFDCFFTIVSKIDKANVLIISHREVFTDKFNNIIRLEKVKNFSRIVE